MLATNFLHLLDLQTVQIGDMESNINHLSQVGQNNAAIAPFAIAVAYSLSHIISISLARFGNS